MRQFTRWAWLAALGAALAAQTGKPAAPIIIGVVVVSEAPPGQLTSGSVVTDPQKYQEIPGLVVVLSELPQPPAPAASAAPAKVEDAAAASSNVLEGVVVDVGDGQPQPANRMLTWIPPLNQAYSTLRVLLRDKPSQPIAISNVPIGRPAPAPSQPVPPVAAPPSPPSAPPPPSSPAATQTPPASGPTGGPVTPSDPAVNACDCSMPVAGAPDSVQVIHGRTDGDAREMKITVDETPAKIVAAKPGAVYWEIPRTLQAGPHEVIFVPGRGGAPVKLPLYVLALKLSADRTSLIRGQSTQLHVVVSGLEHLPASAWQSAIPPADLVDMKRLEQRSPGFKAPKPGDPGVVLLLIENLSTQTIKLGGKGASILLQLHQSDFAKGAFTYDDKIQSIAGGGFQIRAILVGFLKAANGQAPRP